MKDGLKGDAKLRELVGKHIEVYYTKNAETNRERERDRERTIDWIITEYLKGPIPGGVRSEPPDFTFTFGYSSMWSAIKTCVLYCQPDCAICGKPVKEVHHIRPKFLKGKDHPRNVIGLCLECHDEVHRRIDEGIKDVLTHSIEISATTDIHDNRTLDQFGIGGDDDNER